MTTIKYWIRSLQLWLAYKLLPEAETPHICDHTKEGRVFVCPSCARFVCNDMGGTSSLDCDDCWNKKEEAHHEAHPA